MQIVGEETTKKFIDASSSSKADLLKANLKSLFSTVMNAKPHEVKKQVEAMCKRLSAEGAKDEIQALILRLNKQYPLDVGVFAPLFLNYLVLQPGDAMFLTANEPHAYLDGNCIECMACSDNVVRAGLTPKLRDTPTLCSMLTYKAMKPEVVDPRKIDDNSKIYTVPIDEFELTLSEVAASSKYTLKGVKGHSLVLVYEGSGSATSPDRTKLPFTKGSVLFVKGGVDTIFEAESDLILYRCSTKSS